VIFFLCAPDVLLPLKEALQPLSWPTAKKAGSKPAAKSGIKMLADGNSGEVEANRTKDNC